MSELLIASDAKQLADSQRAMISQVSDKLTAALAEARDAERMKDTMIAARLGATQAKAMHRRATDRVGFLTRVKAALEAGYCMMPDMPGDVVAVRTDATRPTAQARMWRQGWVGSVPDHPANPRLPMGEGRYVHPAQECQTRTSRVTHTRHDGSKYETDQNEARAVALRDPDGLDRQFVRPQVIDRMSGAMVRGIFDEIVCVRHTNTRRRNRDPIVLGRVLSGNRRDVAAFLIAWFIDTGEL